MMPRSLKNREKGYTILKPVRITYFTINGIAVETNKVNHGIFVKQTEYANGMKNRERIVLE